MLIFQRLMFGHLVMFTFQHGLEVEQEGWVEEHRIEDGWKSDLSERVPERS